MDRGVPPRVTYWTGIWDPTREALSGQVDTLRHLGGSRAPVVSFSPGQRSALCPSDGVVRLSGSQWPLLRALGACVERAGDVTHVFGPMNAWHLLRAVGRRPVVFTVAIPGPALDAAMFGKVTVFVAETEVLARALRDAGVAANRIRVIGPGVDLARFTPGPSPEGRFRVLFASTPASVSELAARGIPLLIEAARLCPEIDVILLWRQWGDLDKAKQALAALRPPPNVIIDHRDADDIASVYLQAHATVWLAEAGTGKSCPNSVIEGLACGRPAIVSTSCGIGDLVCRSGAGLTPDRTPTAVVQAIRSLTTGAEGWRARARALAEREFGLSAFCDSYRSLYCQLASTPTASASDTL